MNGIFKCSIKAEMARKGGERDYKQRQLTSSHLCFWRRAVEEHSSLMENKREASLMKDSRLNSHLERKPRLGDA